MFNPISLLAPQHCQTTTPVASSAATLDDTGVIGLQLRADGTLVGSWTIFASLKPAGTRDSKPANITTRYGTPSLDDVDPGAPESQSQIITFGLSAVSVWALFTPISGSGELSVDARVG